MPDQWMTALMNFSGMGAIAIVLLLLHREALKQFHSELKEERDGNSKLWQAYMDLKMRQHEQIMQRFTDQDKTLAAQDKSLSLILERERLHRREGYRHGLHPYPPPNDDGPKPA